MRQDTNISIAAFAGVLTHFRRVWLFETLWTVARQTPLSIGFSRQEHWSGLLCPPPGDLPDPGTEPVSSVSCIGSHVLYHYIYVCVCVCVIYIYIYIYSIYIVCYIYICRIAFKNLNGKIKSIDLKIEIWTQWISESPSYARIPYFYLFELVAAVFPGISYSHDTFQLPSGHTSALHPAPPIQTQTHAQMVADSLGFAVQTASHDFLFPFFLSFHTVWVIQHSVQLDKWKDSFVLT